MGTGEFSKVNICQNITESCIFYKCVQKLQFQMSKTKPCQVVAQFVIYSEKLVLVEVLDFWERQVEKKGHKQKNP